MVEEEVENVEELGSKDEEKEEFDYDEMYEDKFEKVREAIGAKYMEMENKDFRLASMNISVAFLQGNILDRCAFMKPLSDQRMDRWLWSVEAEETIVWIE